MRGWIAGIVNWIRGSPEDVSSQVWLREFVAEMTVQELKDVQRDIVQWLNITDPSPRLREFLESGRADASAQVWAIFREPGG